MSDVLKNSNGNSSSGQKLKSESWVYHAPNLPCPVGTIFENPLEIKKIAMLNSNGILLSNRYGIVPQLTISWQKFFTDKKEEIIVYHKG
jgi:hypothetical protein